MKQYQATIALSLAGIAVLTVGLTLIGCKTEAGPGPGGLLPKPKPGRTPPLPLTTPVKGIWVARYHFRYVEDVRTIIENCAAAGCNTVFWQVRGEGTVDYASKIEPWGKEFDYKYPGFDPLAAAIAEAHQRGLRIEAWFNVMPGWKGATPPPFKTQLYYAHPDWFLYDANGRRQPLGKEYVIVNPCLPEVRRYIVSIVDEIVSRYDVDGIHLDYVRYAWDGVPKGKQLYPRDSRTLGLYRHETGQNPDDDPAAWDHWRANQITRLVDDIHSTVDRKRPGATLTAAVWRNPDIGYRDYLQNSVAWLRAGLVDALMPMAYTDKLDQFDGDIRTYGHLAQGRVIVPGLGIYLHKNADAMRDQLARCAAWGGSFALFSYESLFATAGDRNATPRARADAQTERQMRRSVLSEFATR